MVSIKKFLRLFFSPADITRNKQLREGHLTLLATSESLVLCFVSLGNMHKFILFLFIFNFKYRLSVSFFSCGKGNVVVCFLLYVGRIAQINAYKLSVFFYLYKNDFGRFGMFLSAYFSSRELCLWKEWGPIHRHPLPAQRSPQLLLSSL